VDIPIGVNERGLRVEDQTIKIKDEGAYHTMQGGDFFVAPGPMQALTVSHR
jgi:hypothetical protein